MIMYDFVFVGAGLFSSVIAHELSTMGKKCLIVDKRNHVGGNIYTNEIEGINVHQYGAHIFHTDDKNIWDYINQFAEFNRYTNSPIANYNGNLYNLPFNMNTFNKLWPDVITPEQAKKRIQEQSSVMNGKIPENLEEQAISLVGEDIFNILIKGYTEKQWGRPCSSLPASIIKRLPVRFTFDNNYFNDLYQGIPIGGYTQIIDKMISNCEVKLNIDFFDDRENIEKLADYTIFTGMIDQYFDYCFGELEYRTLEFDLSVLYIDNYQGNAVVNYTDDTTPYTRIIEHKHFEYGQQSNTIISKEYSKEWHTGDEPYYPVNDEKNTELYRKYSKLAQSTKNVFFGGRLGMYKYFDMDDTINEALNMLSLIKGLT